MNDETPHDAQQIPDAPAEDPTAREEGPEFSEDDKPGVTDFMKAAKDGAKNLKDLKKMEP